VIGRLHNAHDAIKEHHDKNKDKPNPGLEKLKEIGK